MCIGFFRNTASVDLGRRTWVTLINLWAKRFDECVGLDMVCNEGRIPPGVAAPV